MILQMNVKLVFGNNLHSYRKAAKLSQEQLAEQLGITTKHLSSMETGRAFVSAELLEKIATALQVSVSSLFYSVEEKSSDGSDWSKIDLILEEEGMRAVQCMKLRLHAMRG